ncbi:LETM1 domain-containing protein 1 [Bufo bufo]|uniref:LETM1 domain-containing protein 1 n=1 Tax=Bufo bufo TaxID=8384 RepID=UPI001ABE6159|nr:LETM1 domain-containing protein 1 [Bufo bufo]XP_040281863.1 LETM1 domain-containing protein 1 [Bufo bufo]
MALCRTGTCWLHVDGGRRRRCLLTLYQSCHLSTNQKPQGALSLITSKAKHLNAKYEHFLERKLPNFYILYSTFMKGLRMLFIDGKEVRAIRRKMKSHGIQYHQLPYREMEKLRQFRRDVIKAAPVIMISIPPFANYLVFVLMYFFPRQLLIRYFWTPKQQEEFLEIYHSKRKDVYEDVLDGMLKSVSSVTEQTLQDQIHHLVTQVQHGVHPKVANLQEVRAAFSHPPFCMNSLDVQKMKALSRIMFLTPHLPAFFLQRRLRSHIFEIHHLDSALHQLGVKELTDEEVKGACYIRGLNSAPLSAEDCRKWLNCWLQLSGKLKESEASLLLHSMVLLCVNYLQSVGK